MQFAFSPKTRASRREAERTFRVGRLLRGEADVSHLIDRTYDYRSMRELQWHLAERFSLPVADVVLHRA